MGSIFANTAPSDSRPIAEEYPFDPNLLPATKKLLPELPTKENKLAYAEFLARKIKRNPKDLRSHHQRINLNYKLKNEDAYFGAVIDLLIILGSKGVEIKKSILRPTYDLLGKENANFINKHLRSGVNATQLIPTRESRLSKGLSSSSVFVVEKLADLLDKKPLLSAREKLSIGDLESAQIILENSLEEDSDDIEIAYELLELYRNQNMATSFKKMTTRLADKNITAQEKWLETKTYFSQT